MVAAPCATPLTTPVADTLAVPAALVLHTPPAGVQVSVVLAEVQTDDAPLIAAGDAFMVIACVTVVPQPEL